MHHIDNMDILQLFVFQYEYIYISIRIYNNFVKKKSKNKIFYFHIKNKIKKIVQNSYSTLQLKIPTKIPCFEISII